MAAKFNMMTESPTCLRINNSFYFLIGTIDPRYKAQHLVSILSWC